MPAPKTGQIALSGSAQALSATPITDITAFIVKAPTTNAHEAYIGASTVTTGNGFALDPGDELVIQRNNQVGQPNYQISLADIYAVGTAPDVLTWIGLL